MLGEYHKVLALGRGGGNEERRDPEAPGGIGDLERPGIIERVCQVFYAQPESLEVFRVRQVEYGLDIDLHGSEGLRRQQLGLEPDLLKFFLPTNLGRLTEV